MSDMYEESPCETCGQAEWCDGWDARILETAPKDETPDDVLRKIREQPFLNRGRWAALVVRLGAACRREKE